MIKFKKIIIAILVCMLIIIPQTGCGGEKTVSGDDFCLNTICTITIYGYNEKDAQELIDGAFELCRDYENLLSKTVEGSDIYNINHGEGRPVAVSEETIAILKKAIDFGDMSGGKFDITIGAVTELWEFSGEDPSVPSETEIQEALATVDYTKIYIDGNEVALSNPKAQIDLGGIAKGYIADRVADYLEDAGVEKAMISLGGNIVALGEKDENTPWQIGLERPYSDRSEIVGSVGITNETITTSGVYERCFEQDGVLYHHVLDPDTGYPAETMLDAVTVMGPKGTSMECDALGTIFLMLGEEKSREIIDDHPEFKAAFINADDDVTTANGMKIKPID